MVVIGFVKLIPSFYLLAIQQHNTELLVNMVREQFKKNKHETNPERIQKLKDE